MWKAVFEGKHDSCIIAPLCKKYKVVDLIYLVNAWDENNAFNYSEAHILQGDEANKKKFVKELKKHKDVLKLEQKGNFIITKNKRPAWMSIYMPLWDKKIIQIKPVVQRTDGTELWELACWDKEPLTHILERLPDEFHIKLKSIEETKIGDIFLPHIMPKLSEMQSKTIRIAVKGGYFDFPRKINLEDIAKIMKLKKQTVQQHIRIAEKKLVPFLTENML